MIRAVIFDCDGTLVDSGAMIDLFYEGYHRLYPQRPPKAREEFIACHGSTDQENFKMLDILPQHQANFFELCLDGKQVSDYFHPFPQINEVLIQLKQSGKILGINTSRTHETVKEAREQLGRCYDLFDFVVTSDQICQPKPAPDSLRLCLKKAGCYLDEMVYIGDHPVDQQCADSAEVRFVMAGWGALQPEVFRPCLRLDEPQDLLKFLEI